MEWLNNLLSNPDSIAHIVLLYAFVISIGLLLGKVKFFGISLGVTFVLFVGILVGHFNFTINAQVLNFIKDFGLILFVFCIGLQVGPSFFATFKKNGIAMNLIALGTVTLNVIVALLLFYIFDGRIQIPMIVGILYGAVTNTPGLGAAQETLAQVGYDGPQISLGYACAYPLGVLGIISVLIIIKYLCRVNLEKESEQLKNTTNLKDKPERFFVRVENHAIVGKTISELKELINQEFVCSRIKRNGIANVPNSDTVIEKGDMLCIFSSKDAHKGLATFFGKQITTEWGTLSAKLITRKIILSKSKINGKKLGALKMKAIHNVNITTIERSGVDLVASKDVILQIGDTLTAVGTHEALEEVATMFGDSEQKLREPNIVAIFIGIFLGIIVGSLPIVFPGMPTPVKLGLAGGPLVVAIFLGRYGYQLRLITYTTQSANYMIREIGLVLFLASVGISAGQDFVETVIQGDGLLYVAFGAIITIVPLLIMGLISKRFYKMNYFTLIGMLAGSYTDPPALAYANQVSGNNAPAVGYTTVFPFAMFLRIIAGQVIILMMM